MSATTFMSMPAGCRRNMSLKPQTSAQIAVALQIEKTECWFFLGLENRVHRCCGYNTMAPLTSSTKWGQEVRQTLVEYLPYLMWYSRGQGTSQSGSLLLGSFHSNNNYIIKQTQIKWYLIYIGSLGIEWSLTKIKLICQHFPFLHLWQTYAKSVAEPFSTQHA